MGRAFWRHVPGDLSTGKLIWAALGTDEANLTDLVAFGQGNRFSLVHLEDEISRLELNEDYRHFNVSVIFLLGRHDRHIPAILAEQYFQAIQAPTKRLVWFERSGITHPLKSREVQPDIDRGRAAIYTVQINWTGKQAIKQRRRIVLRGLRRYKMNRTELRDESRT